jgi:hypothetical protein
MDPQGHVNVADTSTATGSATYPPGMSVYDADGEKLGTVSDRQDMNDFLVVHKGRLFGHDAYIPRAAIERADPDGIHLRVRKDELKGMNQTPLPEPTAPIRPNTGAPETVASDQSPAAPIAPPVPVPDMGAASVAATAFSHDVTNEPANALPVESASGAAQDAGQVVETAREQTAPAVDSLREQVGPLFDTLHEHVGPIAEQVKEQASAVTQQQMTSAADGLERAAGLVTAVGEQLRERQLGDLAHYSDLTADQMKKGAAWLRTTTPEEIARNVEDLAKKQPELFVAGAAALGLLGLRLLRGTNQESDEKK